METSERIDQIEARLAQVEAVVLSGRFRTAKSAGNKSARTKPTGPSAGVRILIEQRFFQAKRGLGDVRKGLSDLGYLYSAQAIDMALKRMSGRSGPLVVVREKGKNYYAERK